MENRHIEYDLPLYDISKHSAKEKSIGYGHPNSVHFWPAPRPLAASRATIFAALVKEDDEDINYMIKKILTWDVVKKTNNVNLSKVKKYLKKKWDTPPKTLDPFGGKGIISLEALRLGCDITSGDLNPVAVIIQKAILEWPNTYYHLVDIEKKDTKLSTFVKNVEKKLFLVHMIDKWGNIVINELKNRVHTYYEGNDGEIINSFIWAREITCSNPICKTRIPLIKSFWLSKKKKDKVAYNLELDDKNKKYDVKIYRNDDINFDPNEGIIKLGNVKCPFCNQITKSNDIKTMGSNGNIYERPLIIFTKKNNKKYFRTVTQKDIDKINDAEKELKKLISNWTHLETPLPEEELPPRGSLGFRIQPYGFKKWKDILNIRQKMVLISIFNIFVEIYPKIKDDSKQILGNKYDAGIETAVLTYLALTLDNMLLKYNNLSRWEATGRRAVSFISMNAISMKWDYVEINPLENVAGSFLSYLSYMVRYIELNSFGTENKISVQKLNALQLKYDDESFDAVFTDPPYYDNIPYSDLSDFFYSILKRSVGYLYPDLFMTYLTPKNNEIIADPIRHEDPYNFFESNLSIAFEEIYRVLKKDGIATIVYAFKTTEGWESMLNSLINAKLVVTASWPINTERSARPRANASAALASSIYMVCRKKEREKLGFWNDIKLEIKKRVEIKLEQFWKEGIIGGDFFISAIGPGMEIFSRYEHVETYSGEKVSTYELLEYIRSICSNYVINQLLKNGTTYNIDNESQFYLAYRWTYMDNRVEYDDARKLASSMGVYLEDLTGKTGFINKKGKYIEVLNPKKRYEIKTPKTLIDVVHKCLILWDEGKSNEIKELLIETDYGMSEVFWRYCQAISESLLPGNKEKQLLEGFLVGRNRYSDFSLSREKKNKLDFYLEGKE